VNSIKIFIYSFILFSFSLSLLIILIYPFTIIDMREQMMHEVPFVVIHLSIVLSIIVTIISPHD
jgi:hypothetical protein